MYRFQLKTMKIVKFYLHCIIKYVYTTQYKLYDYKKVGNNIIS